MSIVLANLKKAQLLETTRAYLNSLEYRLFVNNFAPIAAMVLADFTECTDTGYSPEPPAFSLAALSVANKGETVGPTITWTLTHSPGDYTIYGYYVVDPADSDKVVYAERAAQPFTVTAAGQTYSVTPRYTRDTA